MLWEAEPTIWGEGALKSSTMLKKINAARHEEVAGQIKRWNRAGGKVLKGLERYRDVWEERFDRLEN
jgi:lysozyme